ncbi:MAG TPA: phosphopantetheine-binding protein [Chloroflexota bacterium]|nr:phosphopantetheine-binding protein [Chloroflexota bacterium]
MTTLTRPVAEKQIEYTLIDLLRAIAPEADYEALDHTVNLQEALDIDSFDFLNFLISLESAMGVSVPEADYGQLVSLQDIIAYVVARI